MTSVIELPTTPFTRADLEQIGVTQWALERALDERLVRRVVRGVYVRCDQPDTIEMRCQAVSRVIRPGSVVRDRTAAWLHGVDALDHHEKEVLPEIETSVPRFVTPTRRADHAGCTRDLRVRDVVVLHGLRVTTAMRTALDLGCSMRARSALAVIDAILRLHGLDVEQLKRESARFRRRRGVVQLRRLLSMADARSESFGESWVRYELLEAGLPVPELQWWVEVDGVPTYRLDLAYPLHKVAVEYDGKEFHTAPEDRADDAERRAWLTAHGWIVIVVTSDRLDQRSVALWTDEVRQGLRSRTYR